MCVCEREREREKPVSNHLSNIFLMHLVTGILSNYNHDKRNTSPAYLVCDGKSKKNHCQQDSCPGIDRNTHSHLVRRMCMNKN